MNILYINTHDTGRYIQPYGYDVPTPNLQAFAEEGVLFRNAHCAGPTCSPSRAGLLTGSAPHSCGMIGLAHRGAKLFDPSQHLASFLARNGYETALVGVQHEGDPLANGYQHVLQAGRGTWAEQALQQADLVRGLLSASREKPFYIACGFILTHRHGADPFHQETGPRGDGRFVRPPAPLPDTPQTRQDFADFREAAAAYDLAFGALMQALRDTGHAEDTLVIVTTDHGIPFPFMKCNLTVHGTGVLLMLRGPGGFTGGVVVDPLVSHVDVFPTLCDLAGLEKPAWLQGASLLPLLAAPTTPLHDAVFSEVTYHAAYEPMRSIRTAQHLLIRRFEPLPHPVLPNCDASLSKSELLDHGWSSHAAVAEELYDTFWDPNETCNRAADPAYATVLADLRMRLDAWMRATDDPLRDGRDIALARSMGMIVNPVDGVDPNPQTAAPV
jgi:arylsulfatase A-like enzyme